MRFQIHTARLLLRRWHDTDRTPFAAMGANPKVMRYFPSLLSKEESDALVSHADGLFDEYGYGLWAVEHFGSGSFIGFTGLAPMPEGVPGAGGIEVGWRLAHPYWGHGYATEAAHAALTFAFDTLKLNEVNSITATINTPSRAVMERLGMTLTNQFNHPKVASNSKLKPHVRYTISTDVFKGSARNTP
jgi:RimJ/RimL family protein N-acetyltransferase